ncbi:hypothetical protein LMF32_00895 [Desemzia sp. C1]|uniref:hypothetical protein n=1 Tax=Desemzia sp. C1 TaxID=2892016 RepID=UPI001E59B1C8|nr:hypothetical protein [Desemzia sp. C1]MCI3027693.1 hypothetical protein [Desemzia sp. C1]
MLVQNKGEYIRHVGVRLIPGTNNLESEEAEAFKEAIGTNPLDKALVNKELFYDAEKPDAAIKDIKANDALALIADTFDVNLLNQFHDEEEESKNTRTSVLKAIETQIASILDPNEDDIVDTER